MKQLAFVALAVCASGFAASPASVRQHSSAKKAWPAENISGRIVMVDSAGKRLVVEGSDKVPFDIVVTPGTRIRSGAQAIASRDLSQYKDRNATIRFTPERGGEIAQSIQIGG